MQIAKRLHNKAETGLIGKVPHTPGAKKTKPAFEDVEWQETEWENVQVGDFVFISQNVSFPADLIIIGSSNNTPTAFIDTANLDGETSLKLKKVPPILAPAFRTAAASESEEATVNIKNCLDPDLQVTVEPPSEAITTFSGNFKYGDEDWKPLDIENILFRG